jgi:hypothetical protein
MIRIDREIYLKHIFSDLETRNEPSSTNFPVLGNYSCDSDLGNFATLSSDVPLTQKFEMTFQVNLLVVAEEIIFCQDSPSGVADKEDESEKIGRHEEVFNFWSQVWTLYFDGSKSKEGSREGCILIDPKVKQRFLSHSL